MKYKNKYITIKNKYMDSLNKQIHSGKSAFTLNGGGIELTLRMLRSGVISSKQNKKINKIKITKEKEKQIIEWLEKELPVLLKNIHKKNIHVGTQEPFFYINDNVNIVSIEEDDDPNTFYIISGKIGEGLTYKIERNGEPVFNNRCDSKVLVAAFDNIVSKVNL